MGPLEPVKGVEPSSVLSTKQVPVHTSHTGMEPVFLPQKAEYAKRLITECLGAVVTLN